MIHTNAKTEYQLKHKNTTISEFIMIHMREEQ